MKYFRSISWCVLVLSFVPSFASADEPSLGEWAKQRIERVLLEPLVERERKATRFSRSRPPPQQRRVQVTETTLIRDNQGREFVPFRIDTRVAAEWHDGSVVGCVYRATGSLFIKRGEVFLPAASLLGKHVGPVAGVCQAADPADKKS